MAGVDLKDGDFTGADLSQSRLVGVDVRGADFSAVDTTGARAAADWSAAKVQPAQLPESLPTPPPWLPLLLVGVVALVIFFVMRRRAQRTA